MTIPGLTSLDVAGRLRRACADAGGQKAWADQHGVSPQYVCDVLNARREPGNHILAALGLRKVVRYAEMGIAPRLPAGPPGYDDARRPG